MSFLAAVLMPQVLPLPELETLRATLALRLVRVLLFTARLGGLAVPRSVGPPLAHGKEEPRISVIAGSQTSRPATWEEVTQGLTRPPADEWYHASGLERARVAEIARDSGISPNFLTALSETEYPRVEVYEKFSALFTWIPSLGPGNDAVVERNGVLLLTTDFALLTVARHGIDLQKEVTIAVDDMALPRGAFALRTSSRSCASSFTATKRLPASSSATRASSSWLPCATVAPSSSSARSGSSARCRLCAPTSGGSRES